MRSVIESSLHGRGPGTFARAPPASPANGSLAEFEPPFYGIGAVCSGSGAADRSDERQRTAPEYDLLPAKTGAKPHIGTRTVANWPDTLQRHRSPRWTHDSSQQTTEEATWTGLWC